MKKLFIVFICLLISEINLCAQSYNLAFIKTLSIDSDSVAGVQSKTDQNGNTYITGYTIFKGAVKQAFVLKISGTGDKLWTRFINEYPDSTDLPDVLALDSAGNIYVSCRRITGSQTCSGDICTTRTFSSIVTYKYSASGNRLWVNDFGNRFDQLHPVDMKLSANGKIFVVANSTPGYFQEQEPPYTNNLVVEAINTKGVTAHSKVKLNTIADAACLDNLGNLLVSGAFPQSGAGYVGNYYGALIKYANNLTQIWDTIYSDKNRSCELHFVACDSLNNIYVHGYTDTFYKYKQTSINPGVITIKYTSSGIQQWIVLDNHVGGPFIADNNGNTFFTTTINPNVNGNAIKKYNSSGKMIWSLNVDSFSVWNIAKQNGVVYALGPSAQFPMAIATINSLGRKTGFYKTHYVTSQSFQLDGLNNIYVSGTDIFGEKIFLSKFTQQLTTPPIIAELSPVNITMYPNPVNNMLNISLTSLIKNKSYKCFIFDVSGNLLKAFYMNNDGEKYTAQVNTANLHSGTYTLKISDGANRILKTFLKE